MTDVFLDAKRIMLAKLGRPDKSKKGGVDVEAWPLIDAINAVDDWYTTSSCAGRITVFKEPVSGKKFEADWLFVSHCHAGVKDVLASLEVLPPDTVWLRMESPIFHVACRDAAAADRLLRLCQSLGWKRSGIISNGGRRARQRRVMVEIIGNERVDAPIAAAGVLLMGERYVSFLVKKANEKLEISRHRLDELVEAVASLGCVS